MAQNFFLKIILTIVPGMLQALVPPIFVAIFYHTYKKRPVNRTGCSCSCWDNVFKGPYESGVATYKHFYFNATSNMIKIWLLTIVAILVLYETIKHLLSLAVQDKLRYLMAILFATSLYSHFYAWWNIVMYWNDDFYLQWNHQMFFTITELISTMVVLNLADQQKSVTSRKVAVVISIALVHILTAGLDQFVENVVYGKGMAHQVWRDVLFMIPDILHVVFPLRELVSNNRGKITEFSSTRSDIKRELPLMMIIIVVGCGVCYFL